MPLQQKTCYFEPDEARSIAEIADKEERSDSKIVQIAIRAFRKMYEANRVEALEMARQDK